MAMIERLTPAHNVLVVDRKEFSACVVLTWCLVELIDDDGNLG